MISIVADKLKNRPFLTDNNSPMSRSRLAALRKKDLVDLATNLNLSVEGRKVDLETRLVEYLKDHQDVLGENDEFMQYYPSPTKRRTSPTATGGGNGNGSTSDGGEARLGSPPVKFETGSIDGEDLVTPTKTRRGLSPSNSVGSSSSEHNTRRTSRRLSQKVPI